MGVAVVVGCAVMLVGVAGGCRSNAYSDVYNQKMASEVRVLEDQLYEADYQNRVLQEKLQRATTKSQRDDLKPSPLKAETKSSAKLRSMLQSPKPDPKPDAYSPNDFDLGDDIEAGEMIDPGTPAKMESPAKPSVSKAKAQSMPPKANDSLLPAPGGPEPPGPDDLKIPQIVPGEMMPPPSSKGLPEKPPGQIQLPDAVRALSPGGAKVGIPTTLSIHPGLSAGYTFDDGSEGLYLIVNVLDEQQRPLDLESFDIGAPMTIVATDPNREMESSRVGRWEFDASQVAKMVRNEPVSGIAIPLHWQGERPDCETVMVHVRLKGDGEEMRCEAKLGVKPRSIVAEWMPRSTAVKR